MKYPIILLTLIAALVFCPRLSNAGPYAPSETNIGTTAYFALSEAFIGWATGHTNYILGIDESGIYGIYPEFLYPEDTYGFADCTYDDYYWITTLGGGGQITLTFDIPIADGTGYDFAVFENGFTKGFLELAYVEVSSDGTHFFRFPNASLTDSPVDAYIETNAPNPTDIYNLAGKYLAGFGTPFDLNTIPDHELLDKTNIRFVKIIDIIGDGRSTDSSGRPIYDPYPTGGTPGFDLDAIGIINTYNPVCFSISSNSATLSFTALTNRTYTIDWSADLTESSWSEMVPPFVGHGQLYAFTNNITPGVDSCFYRIEEFYVK